MNMMNKCAKFHKDSPSDKKVKFNLPSAIELSETAVLCTTLYRNLTQARNFGGTFDQLFLWSFFYEIFTEDASLLLLYHGAKKSKMTKNSNQGVLGPSRSFRMIEQSTKLISLPNFLPPCLQAFRLSLLVFHFFWLFWEYELNPTQKVLNGKVRNLLPIQKFILLQ